MKNLLRKPMQRQKKHRNKLWWTSRTGTPILKDEIKNDIKDKAPDIDSISAEIIKVLVESGVNIMHTISQDIWRTGRWPFEWSISSSFLMNAWKIFYNRKSLLNKLGLWKKPILNIWKIIEKSLEFDTPLWVHVLHGLSQSILHHKKGYITDYWNGCPTTSDIPHS